MAAHDPLPGAPREPSHGTAESQHGPDGEPSGELASSQGEAPLPPEPPTPAPSPAMLPPEPPTPAPSASRFPAETPASAVLPPEPSTPLPTRFSEIPAARGSRPSVPPPRRSVRPPLLASEALMEDLAPVEPLGQQARMLCLIAGLLFALLGALPLLGVQLAGQAALVPSLVVGAVTVFAAAVRVSYRKRAVAMVALGAIVAGLGIAGTGPAQGIAQGGALWSAARWLGASVLPAAVLFRARYRAFKGVRLLLGLAFVAALPFAIHALLLLLESGGFGFVHVGALLVLASLIAALPGFMGSETTAAGSLTAPAMIAAFALQAGFQRLGALVPGSFSEIFGVAVAASEEGGAALPGAIALTASAIWDAAVTSIALSVSSFLSALGLFQILSWKFAPAARQIDVRRNIAPESEERPSLEDWSTRA